MHESFLVYRRFRYLKLALFFCVASSVMYILHDPIDPPNGGTWLGYLLGSLGAGIILLLTYFGVRKRNYKSRAGMLEGWLSAHVYLGGSLIFIATLHSGFDFGWNVHTLAYVLMCLVIVAGFFGVIMYVRYPEIMSANNSDATREEMLAKMGEIDRECLAMANDVSPKAHQVILRSIERTQVGGSVLQQLSESEKVVKALAGTTKELDVMEADMTQMPGAIPAVGYVDLDEEDPEEDKKSDSETVFMMAGHAGNARAKDVERIRRIMNLIGFKKGVARRLRRDIKYRGLMQIWLYLHVPLSFALLASLIAHIVSVFLYW